jgi:hypothetical protein
MIHPLETFARLDASALSMDVKEEDVKEEDVKEEDVKEEDVKEEDVKDKGRERRPPSSELSQSWRHFYQGDEASPR